MSITLPKSREKNAAPCSRITDIIDIGTEVVEIYKKAKFYTDLQVNRCIASIIRDCNGALGMAGNFKQGCLYYEGSAKEMNRGTVCDHSIPVTELVRVHREKEIPIALLAFMPIVRITKNANENLTEKGLAKRGFNWSLPLLRYTNLEGFEIFTHKGDSIDPNKWSMKDHWDLCFSTEELEDVFRNLNLTEESIKTCNLPT